MMNIFFFLTGLAVVLVSACNVSPNLVKSKVEVPSRFSQNDLYHGPVVKHWSEVYKDAKLRSLVKKARGDNHSLKALYQRTLQSRAIIKSEGAGRLPQVGVGGSYTRFSNSEEVDSRERRRGNLYNGALTAGWELDLFGRVANLVKSAQFDAVAADAAYEDLLLITETDVALSYFNLRSLEGEIQAVKRSAETRQEALIIVKQRFDGGIVSDLDVAQAEVLYSNSQSALAELQQTRDVQMHALAVLTGQSASSFQLDVSPLESRPTKIPAGLPSELLLRRPDVRKAEYQLRSTHAEIAVAKANFYPRVTLGASGGFTSYNSGNLFTSAASFYDFGPSVKVPLFVGGKLRANLSRAEYAYTESVEVYKQKILEAFAEVENAMKGWRHLSKQRTARELSVSAAKRAQKISDAQYRGGIVDFTVALDSERVTLDAERNLSQVIGAEYANSVLLIRAIGGSWK